MGRPDLKQRTREALSTACDVAGLVVGASGATLVAVLGKLAAAVVLGAIALGFFLRLGSRRRVPPAPTQEPVRAWVRAVSAILSVAGVSLLVEATDLPVRFHQPGFEPWHWVLVGAALALAYSLCTRGVRRLLESGRRAPQS